MLRTVRTAAALLLAGLISAPATADAAPLTFLAPPPLDRNEIGASAHAPWISAPDGPGPEDADERVLLATVTALAGIGGHATAAVTVPWVDRTADLATPGGDRVTRRARGPGDA